MGFYHLKVVKKCVFGFKIGAIFTCKLYTARHVRTICTSRSDMFCYVKFASEYFSNFESEHTFFNYFLVIKPMGYFKFDD